ncbi:MAG: hypothetical protein AAGB22_13860, partial [Bacteroidota bacterium]
MIDLEYWLGSANGALGVFDIEVDSKNCPILATNSGLMKIMGGKVWDIFSVDRAPMASTQVYIDLYSDAFNRVWARSHTGQIGYIGLDGFHRYHHHLLEEYKG